MAQRDTVAFYSFSGKTERVADYIAAQLGCGEVRINEAKKRSAFSAFLMGSLAAMQHKPSKLAPLDFNSSAVAEIYLCTPIWAGNITPAAVSFLQKYMVQGKNVRIITTASGAENKALFQNIKPIVEGIGCKFVGLLQLNPKVDGFDAVTSGKEGAKLGVDVLSPDVWQIKPNI